ncbi:MAG: signal peptidase II [Azospirillum sp.]|nr:signal peptidase II [Azospirillum sp.]
MKADVSAVPRPDRWGLGLVVAAIVIILDQAVKWWMLTVVMQPPRPIEVTSYFTLVMAWNRGVSFGMFAGETTFMPYLLIAVALGIVGLMIAWLLRTSSLMVALSLGLVIGGALGNVIDRIRFGAVADFLYFHLGDWYFPAFNIADSGISVGVGLILINSLFSAPDRR